MYAYLIDGELTVVLGEVVIDPPRKVRETRLQVEDPGSVGNITCIELLPDNTLENGKPVLSQSVLTIPVNSYESWRLCSKESVRFGTNIPSRMSECREVCRQITLSFPSGDAPARHSTLVQMES